MNNIPLLLDSHQYTVNSCHKKKANQHVKIRDLTHILHHSTPIATQSASNCCPAIQSSENSFVHYEKPPINRCRD